ncbi:MAG: hypothetical protein BYD32DRAFT_402182 [Podila humilis]|nr:MAG: hypothetical protein BYD32DRAFT_402182 [Podila humilis]
MATPTEEYNILFLGETQSGKSTSIESLRKYADPNYIIEKENLGDGIFSKTSAVSTASICTNLPSYFVTDKARKRVDYGKFIEDDQEDYEDELNDRKSYQLEREESYADRVSFRLIDTPGLNDTALNDESNIAIIFKALENIKSIHLVVITVANNPFTEGLKDALKAYVHLLPELNGNIVFLHTRIDYSKMHREETVFAHYMDEKTKILHELMGRNTVPHLLIDNDLNSQRTIRNCITQNTLRNLLDLAKLNQPIRVRVMVMNKTDKMLIVDDVLKQKYTDQIQAREKTLGGKNREEQEVLTQIGDLKAKIAHHEQHLLDIKRDLAFYDKDTLVLLYEESYQQGVTLLGFMEGVKTMYFPGKKRASSPEFVHHVIDHIDILARNVNVLQDAGGFNHPYWAVRFRRRKHQNGLYAVKIYITKRKMFIKKIENWKTIETTHQGKLKDCIADLEDLERQKKERKVQIDELVEQLKMDYYLLGRVSTTTLDSKVFHALVAAQVYVRDIGTSSTNVERFYFQNKGALDGLEHFVEDDAPLPVNTSSNTNDKGVDVAEVPNSNSKEDEFKSEVDAITKAVKGMGVDMDGDTEMEE